MFKNISLLLRWIHSKQVFKFNLRLVLIFMILVILVTGIQSQNEDSIITDLYNYPNPFNPDEGPTHIVYDLARNADIELLIYDLAGGRVLQRSFASGTAGAVSGRNVFDWNGENDADKKVAAGAYICAVRVLVSEKGTRVYERKSTKIGVMR